MWWTARVPGIEVPVSEPKGRSGNKTGPLAVLLTRRSPASRLRPLGAGTSRYPHVIIFQEFAPMLKRLRRTFTELAVCFGFFAMIGIAQPQFAIAENNNIAQTLRAGGFVIVVRHGATFPDQADTDPLNFDKIAAQRNLNDNGKALAKVFGDAIRKVGIPVGKVYTSQYNRAYETAVLAGFKDIEKTADVTEGGLVVSPNENNRRAEAFRKMLGTSPEPGTNSILITHKPNIVDGLGKDWFDVKEGEASIFRPENGAYKLVARVPMDEWINIGLAAR
jgi:phosphohistidine phosphatase SixA